MSALNDTSVSGIIIYTNLQENAYNLNQIENAPIYLFCSAVSLAAISAFLRSGFILKLITMVAALICQIVMLSFSDLYAIYNRHQLNA